MDIGLPTVNVIENIDTGGLPTENWKHGHWWASLLGWEETMAIGGFLSGNGMKVGFPVGMGGKCNIHLCCSMYRILFTQAILIKEDLTAVTEDNNDL